MDLKKILVTMSLMGLFTLSMFAFIIQTQTDSSVTNKITDNALISKTYTDLQSSLSNKKAEDASNNFGKSPPTEKQLGELDVTSIISPTNLIRTLVVGIWNIFVKLPMAILGVSPIVTTLLGSLLLIFLIIGAWAIWKGVIPQ